MADPAAKFFRAMWEHFLDASDVEGDVLEAELEAAGLAFWGVATAEQASKIDGMEAGDPLLILTDAGKAALAAGRD